MSNYNLRNKRLKMSGKSDSLASNMRAKCNEIINYLKENASFTKIDNEKNKSILEHPLFTNTITHTYDNYKDNCTLSHCYNMFLNNSNFPFKLSTLYKIVGNENVEIKINDFTFMELSDIYDRRDVYIHIIDIGMIYTGMGHVITLAMDKKTQQFIFKADGGSNGYERQMYFNKYYSLQPEKSCDKKYLYSFDKVLELLPQLIPEINENNHIINIIDVD